MASWQRIAERSEQRVKKLESAIEKSLNIISYDDKDEDEKLQEIENTLKNTFN
jgi:hypothetical protein